LFPGYNDEGILYLFRNQFVFTPSLCRANPQIQEWGYFNYLIYHLVERAAGATSLSFAAYPASPVPHASDRNGLFIFLGVELILFFGAFVLVRRYSLAHPEALDARRKPTSLRSRQRRRIGKVGFHRPLPRCWWGWDQHYATRHHHQNLIPAIHPALGAALNVGAQRSYSLAWAFRYWHPWRR
jgi:hypothetical protein